jgi:hypothetical protein
MHRRRKRTKTEPNVLPVPSPRAADTLADYWSQLAGKAYPDDADLADPLLKDRASIFAALGITADLWQRQLIESTASQTLVLASRQSGKSIASAACALTEALLNPPAEVLIISRAQRQSAEVLRKCRDFYRGLRGERVRRRHWRPTSIAREVEAIKARGIREDEIAREVAAIKARGIREDEIATTNAHLSMEFANGSRIISLPGSPDTIVGFSAISLLILDEAARIKDDLYALVRPMLAVSGGRLIALSTPFGKRGWFFSAWSRCDDCRLRGQPEPWQRFRITAEECPRISADFLAEERLAIGDRWFNQEYGCLFTETIDSVFAHDDIMAMLGSTEKPLLEMCREADEEWRAINRPSSLDGVVTLDGSLSSDARPLVDM